MKSVSQGGSTVMPERVSRRGLPRMVSLLPSATEIVVGLGLGDGLVGRSHECDFPPEIEALPVLTGPKFSSDGTSAGIDSAVSKLVREGLSVYWVDTEKLDELRPDIILTQSQCELCAVSMKDVEEAVCSLVSSKPSIINLEPSGYEKIFSDFWAVGEALEYRQEAEALIRHVRGGIESLDRKREGKKKRVLTIEWLDPLMHAGNWVPTLIEKAGGINCLGVDSEHAHYITFNDVVAADPDVVLIMPCGFGMEKSMAEINRLKMRNEWQSFMKNNDIYLCDGNHFFNRPGPRILESAEIVAEILYPDDYDFGHKGKAWQRL